ncbi:MAG: type II secretion system GspH family protein [Candidatus Riflebacteria bacterium]|nr:type II secretion system GspH family protein [Candidatus Riflebacteria bacterium]
MKRAFTMVELMVVCAIMMLILIPTFRIMSYGQRSASKGMQRNRVVMEGQQILSQLKMDLAISCFVFVNDVTQDINDIFTETSSGGDITLSFHTFNGGLYENKVIPTSSGPESYRRMNRVEYRLTSRPGTPFKKLERRLLAHPSMPPEPDIFRVLSDQVNFFEIRPETVTSVGFPRSFFRISLQLFDQEEGSGTAGKAFIADFMDTANPTILNSIINNPNQNRNWYTDPHDSN